MKTTQPGRREELLDAIAREEGRVARLESEQADSRRRLAESDFFLREFVKNGKIFYEAAHP